MSGPSPVPSDADFDALIDLLVRRARQGDAQAAALVQHILHADPDATVSLQELLTACGLAPVVPVDDRNTDSGLYKINSDSIKSSCLPPTAPVNSKIDAECEGVAMSVSPQLGRDQRQHGRRRQALAEALLHDILQGRLRAGEHLVIRTLSQRFDVSATPLREAFITLAGMGLVDLLPNRGAVVRQISAEQVVDLLQVRRALECAATRSACGRVRRKELEALASELRRLIEDETATGPAWVEAARAVDSRLHDLVAASCRNLFLAKELERFKMLFRAFRDVAWQREEARQDYRRLREEAVEHLAIVNALLARDGKEAARAMARHIRGAARYWRHVAPDA